MCLASKQPDGDSANLLTRREVAAYVTQRWLTSSTAKPIGRPLVRFARWWPPSPPTPAVRAPSSGRPLRPFPPAVMAFLDTWSTGEVRLRMVRHAALTANAVGKVVFWSFCLVTGFHRSRRLWTMTIVGPGAQNLPATSTGFYAERREGTPLLTSSSRHCSSGPWKSPGARGCGQIRRH